MIRRFTKIRDGIYRGSAPSVADVKILKDKFGINKIISLDEQAGKRIDKICKLLGIAHIIIPIDVNNMSSIEKLLSYNLKYLLEKDGPTFIHCAEGKDRTGMVIAMYKCKYMNYSYDKAIKEAESLGFGIGVDPKIVNFYKKLIKMSCNKADNNSADIIDKSREEASTSFDEGNTKSWAPFLDYTRQYPYNPTYDYSYDQYPTRNNYKKDEVDMSDEELSEGNSVPLVGLYDNDAGIKGVGPVENGGGFVNT